MALASWLAGGCTCSAPRHAARPAAQQLRAPAEQPPSFADHAVEDTPRERVNEEGRGAGNTRAASQPVPASARPVVAWVDSMSGTQEIYLKRWSGQSWDELGGSAHGGGVSTTGGPGHREAAQPRVALDSDGFPVVAWTQRVGCPYAAGQRCRDEIYLKRWNGHTWVEVGNSAHGNGISNSVGEESRSTDPSLAIDRQGRPVVAWQAGRLRGGVCCDIEVYLRRWSGSVWEELAGSASGGGLSHTANSNVGREGGGHPAVAVIGGGRPVVAWSNNSTASGCQIYLRRWSGQSWNEMSGSASGGGLSRSGSVADPSIAIGLDGHPLVVWPLGDSKGAFAAIRWDGSTWAGLGPVPSSAGCSAGLTYAVAVDQSDQPVVAHHQLGGNAPLAIDRWNGAAWEPLPRFGTNYGEIGLAADGPDLVVAWSDAWQIRAARWNGQAWDPPAGALVSSPNGRAWAPVVASSVRLGPVARLQSWDVKW